MPFPRSGDVAMEATLALSVNAPSTLCARRGETTAQLLSPDLSTQKCCQTGPLISYMRMLSPILRVHRHLQAMAKVMEGTLGVQLVGHHFTAGRLSSY